MIGLLVTVGTVIVVSAACSLFEAALYSVPMSHVEALAGQGRSSGRVLQRLRQHVDRPIAAILSLNTIANTAGAALAGAVAVSVFGGRWLPYFSAALTIAILVFSEVVPKTAGVVYAKAIAPKIAHPLRLLVWLMTPLVWLSRGITLLIKRGGSGPSISQEELLVMAKLGHKAGTIEADEVQVIENVLALERKCARDVMTPRSVMFAVSLNVTAEKARGLSGFSTYSRWPVYDMNRDDIVGIVHRGDILSAVADDQGEKKMEDLMRPAHFVSDATPLDTLLRYFLERRQHLAVAIDDHGSVSGVVTLEDVLEEIIGKEIVDETDQVADLRELARRRREKLLKGASPEKSREARHE